MMTIRNGLLTGATLLAIGAIALLSTSPSALAGKGAKQQAKVGEEAPNFTLVDLQGESHTLSDFTADGKIVVLEWINPQCPYVVKHHSKMSTMTDLATKYEDKVVWIAINSAHDAHSTYAKNDKMMKTVEKYGIEYPILVDADGHVGHMYGAKTTPHMYIIDTEGILRYAGAIDSDRGTGAYSEKKQAKVVNYVDQALAQVIKGETVTQAETKSYGCSVKYAR